MAGKLLLVASSLVLIVAIVVLLSACMDMFRTDNEVQYRNSQRALREVTAANRAATAQTKRGTDLSGDALRGALAGRTLVQRYDRFPDGRAGAYAEYQYFLADGRFVVVDNWINLSAEPAEGDYWSVSGSRVCLLSYRKYGVVRCFRVAQGEGGELQFYTDKPGAEYDGLLEFTVGENVQGPPPSTK